MRCELMLDGRLAFVNSVESAQALEAQREVLTHGAAEEFHGRHIIFSGYDVNTGI